MTTTIEALGQRACQAKKVVAKLPTNRKNETLCRVANDLVANQAAILAANAQDMANGRANGMPDGLLDRLYLDAGRIEAMAEGLTQIAKLDDPIGEVTGMKKRPNGLLIGQTRVPLGVVGIIYEARPNVTADAFGLCFKTGNAVILKGGRDAIHSIQAIVASIRASLEACGIEPDCLLLVEDLSREATIELMKQNRYLDVLIPRGGAGLIRSVVENSTVPVIETGTGNCHIFVDESADLEQAVAIILNAKTQRVGVCNAVESLVVHRNIVDALLPDLALALRNKQVEMVGDDTIVAADPSIALVSEADWGTEYLALKLSIKTVDSVDEAIEHINTYNTGHSEAILTNDYAHAQQFLKEVDAACVYVNASTRFTDGFEFGYGAEIGISTQKLHARGPMGLLALTTTKFIILGSGQVRP
ncbi:glutamate-5-semialdehyde dehydrogenase [uncultured Dubosiella sp.]|uniref:glutamate-5-semialdehyde dehydrogenase n=1 Tax=uncultured Dubosiella sp. TaxID=1937011 RepID=UPI002731BD02|nr:glutamate-5-semialdehyde dehydrogenase [uncultured Dubosiella sp.]